MGFVWPCASRGRTSTMTALAVRKRMSTADRKKYPSSFTLPSLPLPCPLHQSSLYFYFQSHRASPHALASTPLHRKAKKKRKKQLTFPPPTKLHNNPLITILSQIQNILFLRRRFSCSSSSAMTSSSVVVVVASSMVVVVVTVASAAT